MSICFYERPFYTYSSLSLLSEHRCSRLTLTRLICSLKLPISARGVKDMIYNASASALGKSGPTREKTKDMYIIYIKHKQVYSEDMLERFQISILGTYYIDRYSLRYVDIHTVLVIAPVVLSASKCEKGEP